MQRRLTRTATGLFAAAALALAPACSSDQPRATDQDPYGNYATTSNFHSMQRAEFEQAIRAGLEDFDRRYRELRTRANELGGDTLDEFADWTDDLEQKRDVVQNELARMDTALDDEWPDRREATLEAYEDLRDCLDEAYEEVFEEA